MVTNTLETNVIPYRSPHSLNMNTIRKLGGVYLCWKWLTLNANELKESGFFDKELGAG